MALTPRRPAAPSLLAARVALAGALAAGAALTAAAHAGAQPVPPVDPAAPPVPPAAAAPAQPFTVLPLAEGEIPPPAPPPVGAPYIPPVPGGDFNNTGQLQLPQRTVEHAQFRRVLPADVSRVHVPVRVRAAGALRHAPATTSRRTASARFGAAADLATGRHGARTDSVVPSGSAPSGSAGYPRRVSTSVRPAVSRRGFLTMTASAALVAACSSQKPGEVAKDGSVTVKAHLRRDQDPGRRPSGWSAPASPKQDDLLAVGVVPIAVTDWFGRRAVRRMALGAAQTG